MHGRSEKTTKEETGRWGRHSHGGMVTEALALSLLAAGCSAGSNALRQGDPADIDTSLGAFEEYSSVQLPDGVDEPDITAERDDDGNVEYKVHFSGSPDEAEEVCRQVKGWLPHLEGTSTEEQQRFGIDADVAAKAGEETRECTGIDQESGTQTEGLVLYSDDETADVYLRTYEINRR